MYMEKSCKEFLEQLSSISSVPGGGGAAAMVGALAAALTSMVGNFTAGKKKYEKVEEDIKAILAQAGALREELEQLVERDAEVLGGLLAVYKMPGGAQREEALCAAASEATLVPLAVCAAALKVERLAVEVLQKGNKMLASDAVLSGLFARAAARGAYYNVLINLPLCRDENWADGIKANLEALLQECEQLEKQLEEEAKPLFA